MDIILNKTQTKKMLKAKGLLEDMFDNGKSHGLTPYCIKDMASCYNEIVKSVEHYGMTMCEEVANMFRRCGFRVEDAETPDTIPHWHVHILTEKQEKEIEK